MASKRPTFLIIGLGLIGGSLALALRKRFPNTRVLGVSREERKIALAKKRKLIQDGSTVLSKMVPSADLIFVCSPVDTIPKIISAIDRWAKPGTIVTDVGSTKEEIVRAVDSKRLKRVHFVGSHPLAGSHLTGIGHARADLFKGSFVFVTPTSRTNRQALRAVSSLWKKLGTSVCVLSPKQHDQIVSQISHLPHAVASLLVQSVDSKSLRFSGSGFRDTTRIAQGDPRLWTPIFLSNKTNLIRDLRRLKQAMETLLSTLKKRTPTSLTHFLKAASSKRAKIRTLTSSN